MTDDSRLSSSCDVPPEPTARVSLPALRANIQALRARLPKDVAFAAVVKSDGYGHGAGCVSRAAMAEGSRFLAVSSLAEALALRQEGVAGDILIVAPVFPEEAPEAVAGGFALCVGNVEMARLVNAAASAQGRRARLHLNIDTGMGRFGFLPEDPGFGEALDRILNMQNIDLEGVATHFAEADVPYSGFTLRQVRVFRLVLREIQARGVHPRWIHAANSGGVVHFPAVAAFSLARIGISMYGACPGPAPDAGWNLEPVMSLTCRVVDLRNVPAGAPVSYGRTFITRRASRLALLPVGYGDGYPRSASGRAAAVVRGRRAPIVGRVTMNLVVVDVTDVEGVRVGDPALLFGQLGADLLRVEDLAHCAGALPHEILCNVGQAVPRIVISS